MCKVLYGYDAFLAANGCTPTRTAYMATAEKLEDAYKNYLRKPLNAALLKFCASGNGDGGPVEVGVATTVYSAKFFDYCRGQAHVRYAYDVFLKQGLFAFAASAMPSRAAHNSSGGSNTSGSFQTPPGGAPGSGGGGGGGSRKVIGYMNAWI